MIIRKMREEEIGEVLKIEQKELYPELTLEQIRKWEKGEGPFTPQCFVAEIEKTIVGFIVLSPYEIRNDEILLELSVIAVKRQNQKQGIGRKLLMVSLSKAKDLWLSEGFKVTGLLIEAGEDEEGAIVFYEKVFPNLQKKVFKRVWEDGEGIVFYFFPFPKAT